MRIKRFEAKDTQSALALVKQEMGGDAIILGTKSLGGKGKARRIEVVAAMDYDLDNLMETAEVKHVSKGKTNTQSYGYHSVRRSAETPLVPQLDKPSPEKIHSEAHDLRLRFANLLQIPAGNKSGDESKPQTAVRPFTPQRTKRPLNPVEVKKWRDQLIDKIQLSSVSKVSGQSQDIIALVGATGVGKTTTAAKLAAWHSLRKNRSVAMISMDCYRIGATDQLRTYANIMRLPCEIVLRKKDMNRAISRHQDKDVIIIDTAGKSPYDANHITELNDWFSINQTHISPHLVLSATTKKEDLGAILNSYAKLPIAGLILTKLDETRAYAALCQQVVAASLPVSYLSTGQRVPEDFLAASKDFLDILFKQGWQAAAPRAAYG